MRNTHSFLALAALAVASATAISGCSSAYRTTQTPDDVYYSQVMEKNPVTAAAPAGGDQPEYYTTNSPSDQYIQMKVQDEARWSYFDDYNYYDSYYAPVASGPYLGGASLYGLYGSGFGYGLAYNPFNYYYNPYGYWDSYYSWNSYYNPYFYNPHYGGGMTVANPRFYSYGTTAYSGLRSFSPATYRSTGINPNNNTRFYSPGSTNYYTPPRGNQYVPATNSNNNNNYRAPANNNYQPANNNYQPSSQPVRSYSPPPSSGGGGGGGGGVSRPGR